MGALQNSVVIIMGINGTNVPSFDQKGIGSLGRDIYLRTPVIINVNRKFPITGERSRYASAVNMYSTILDLMKMPLPEVSDSKSLASIIEADVMEGNEIVVTELFSPLNLYPALALREKRLKLHYFQPEGVEATEIFYDLQQDPNERRKLISAPKDITNMLEKKLFSILEKLDMDIYSPEKNKWAAHYLRLITEERELRTD
jgi:arylsulfatase A-like enzyme